MIATTRIRWLFLAAALTAGCSATPEASRQRDAQGKLFESGPRSTVIYLYRADSGSRGVSTVWVDGRLVGQTLPATYFRVIARPGKNLIHATGSDAGRLAITTREGNVYFVSMHVIGEGEGESSTMFRMVAPEAGEAAIRRCCTMLETWRPGQDRLSL